MHDEIIAAVASIPGGCVTSYGAVAQCAGWPGRARLVGTILRSAGADTGLPWHRVLRADGRLAFDEGSAAHAEQLRRLVAEGVLVRNGRIDLRSHGCEPDLDALLWAPEGAGAGWKRRDGLL